MRTRLDRVEVWAGKSEGVVSQSLKRLHMDWKSVPLLVRSGER